MLLAERDELQRCEAVIEGGLRTFVEVGTALLKVRDERLYRGTHKTFEDYCRERWGIARRTAYQLMEAAEVVGNVRNCAQIPPANESQARPLVHLEPEKQREAWRLAVTSAPNHKPTAKLVEAAVRLVEAHGEDEMQEAARGLVRHPDSIATRMLAIATNGVLATNGTLPGQTSFLEPHEELEPPDLELASPDDAIQEKVDGFRRTYQKVLGMVCAVDDFGLARITSNWSGKQKQATAYGLANLIVKLQAWVDFLKGADS